MRDLRLIGVHDDGEHLVVTDDSTGEEYRLRIDEPLRAAARRDRPRLGQLQIAIDNNVRPREVQAMIRAGATADEVSARTGWDLDKIARFEGPVLAEREHVAERAQAVRMRGTTQSGAPETLGDRARARFAGRGVESSSVQWDARRSEDGQWTVSATFVAGGRERNATWWFDVPGMSVVAKNDEAKWLSEADAPAGPVPASVHRPTAVFDVEVEETRAERAQRADPDELIASMREHSGARGRRRGGRRRSRGGDATAPDDALPFDAGDERPPAARGPHEKDVAAQDTTAPTDRDAPVTEDTEDPTQAEAHSPSTSPTVTARTAGEEATSEAPPTSDPDDEAASADPSHRDEAEPAATPSEETADTSAPEQGGATAAEPTPEAAGPEEARDDAAQDDADEEDGAQRRDSSEDAADQADSDRSSDKKSRSGRGRGRKGRASVPSWDDVMFGTTRD